MPHVLFICTANYYRSRFCEHLFNHLANQQHLTWTATSGGVALELGSDNVGPISPFTIQGLQARGVPRPAAFRDPRQVTEQDLKSADQIIVLDEQEHRPHMETKFPAWTDQVTYWQVGDLHVATIEDALALAERKIKTLIQQLSGLSERHDQNTCPTTKPQPDESDTAAGHWEFCPRCSARLINLRCKFVCQRCGYFLSCSDFDA